MSNKRIQLIGRYRIEPPNERFLQLIMSPHTDQDCGDFTVLMSSVAPMTGQTGLHTHPVDEFIYIIDGYGEAEEGGKRLLISTGTSLYIKAGIEHNCSNTGHEIMKMLCVYVPSLPGKIVNNIVAKSSRTQKKWSTYTMD